MYVFEFHFFHSRFPSIPSGILLPASLSFFLFVYLHHHAFSSSFIYQMIGFSLLIASSGPNPPTLNPRPKNRIRRNTTTPGGRSSALGAFGATLHKPRLLITVYLPQRHPCSWRLRTSRHRQDDPRHQIRARAKSALPRYLSRIPTRCGRMGERCVEYTQYAGPHFSGENATTTTGCLPLPIHSSPLCRSHFGRVQSLRHAPAHRVHARDLQDPHGGTMRALLCLALTPTNGARYVNCMAAQGRSGSAIAISTK